MEKVREQIKKEILFYKGPVLLYSKALLREKLNFFGKFAKEKNVNFLFTVKSFPNKMVLNIANKCLCGFDVSNINEYNLLPQNIENQIIVINNPTSYSKDIDGYLKNGNDIIFNLDNIKYIDDLMKNVGNSRKITLGMRLSHTDLDIDLNKYPHGNGASRFGEPLSKLPEFYKKVNRAISVHLHNGSEENTAEFYIMAAKSILNTCKKNNVELKYINFGGGLHNLSEFEIENLVNNLRSFIPNNITILFEPGNVLSKDCGFALSKIMSIKKINGKFVVFMDASYECNFKWSDPKPLDFKEDLNGVDVVFYGPTCYEDDFMMNIKIHSINGKLPFKEGDILTFTQIFGYCFAWNTSFNGVSKAYVKFV